MLDGVVDVVHLLQDFFLVVGAVHLSCRIDNTAAVDHEVGSVVDATLLQSDTGSIVQDLVVSTTGNSLTLQLGNGGGIQNSAHSVGGEDVALLGVNFLGRNDHSAELLNGLLSHFLIGAVGDDQLGAAFVQMTAQVIADLAQTLHSNGQALQIVTAQGNLSGSTDTLPYTAGGEGRGVTGVHGQTADVLGLAHHDQGIVAVGVYVLSGDVVAAQIVNSLAEGLEHCLSLHRGVSDDNALTAAVGQAGNCVLVGHTAAQAQNIKQGIVVGCVGEQTAAADGGAQIGVVNGNNRLQACLLVVDKQDFFMTVFAHFGHCIHK